MRRILSTIPDMTDPGWQQLRSDEQLLDSILNGKGADMPGFRSKIGEGKVRDLVRQVRKFQVQQEGRRLAVQRNPVTESRSTAAAQKAPDPTEDDQQSGAQRPLFPEPISWLGKFHPTLVHFPIGLLLGAAVMELLLWFTGCPLFEAASRVTVWLGALGAVPAATLGWFLAGPALSDANRILATHRWLGTSAVICAGLSCS